MNDADWTQTAAGYFEPGSRTAAASRRAHRAVKQEAADAASAIRDNMMADGRFSVADVTRMGDLANEYGRQAVQGGTPADPSSTTGRGTRTDTGPR